MQPHPFPLPIAEPETQPFWDACKEGRLLVQRCEECNRYRYPPASGCPHCGSERFAWRQASGKGTVYSYSVTHQAVSRAFEGRVPWAVVAIELEEGVLMLSNLLDCPPEKVRIGMPVVVEFREVSPGVTLPYFRVTK